MEAKEFWADQEVKKIIQKKGKSKQIVACGVTPSGPFHLGHFKEVGLAYALFEGLKQRYIQAEFIYLADDFDPLRRLYPFLPASYQKYIGWPLLRIPDPFKCHQSYSEHFLAPFFEDLKKVGFKPKVYYASKLYQKGFYTPFIQESIKAKDKIIQILTKITGRTLEKDWLPFHALCQKCGRLDTTKVVDYDLDKNLVYYQCTCGGQGAADFSKGEGKLPWRLDWPARWKMLKVTVEPMGKDHAAAGGSWESGQLISKEIFHYQPPYPLFYEWIHLKGQGAMSSSQGIAFTASDFLSFTYPEVLRYFLFRSQPSKHIEFDPQGGFLNLLRDFSKLEQNYQKDKITQALYRLVNPHLPKKVLSGIPFEHLVYVVQASLGKEGEIKRMLSRSGFKKEIKKAKKLKQEIAFAQAWLLNYASPQYKLSLQKKLPSLVKKLKPKQKSLLLKIAEELAQKDWPAEELHNKIYEIGHQLGLESKDIFPPIYMALLGQTFGPKAGWFLASLDKKWVIKRLKEAAK